MKPSEDLLAFALTNMGWSWDCCCQAEHPGLGMVLKRVHHPVMCPGTQTCASAEHVTWNITLGCILIAWTSQDPCWFVVGTGRGAALPHSLDRQTEHIHGTGDDHRCASLFLFSRFSVASNPMQSLSSPTRMEWSFWCATKMKGFM